MLRNLTKSTRCVAFHLNIGSTACKKYASKNISLKIVPEHQVLRKNYATAAKTANRKSILGGNSALLCNTVTFILTVFILSK